MKERAIYMYFLIMGLILFSCNDNQLKVAQRYERCIDDGIKEKREFWGVFLKQDTKDTFLNFENYLLIKGYIKEKTKEEYKNLVNDVIEHPEKYSDVYNHVYHHDQYVDTKIIFNPDLVLLYCPSVVLEQENSDLLMKQLKIMQEVLETDYGNKESANKLFEITPPGSFKYLAFRIPAIYMVLLKTIQFHTVPPNSSAPADL